MLTDRCSNTSGQNSHAKETDKKLKYKRLCIKIQRIWGMKCMIITVIHGATGMVREGLTF